VAIKRIPRGDNEPEKRELSCTPQSRMDDFLAPGGKVVRKARWTRRVFNKSRKNAAGKRH
jgi:hypothetical protein